ncbi:MAG: ribonuclease HII [Alphaproteobacteria bacterium]|nr:ribonuclease HII [Alphaproteobacteria bacterium]USO07660.1 MAG: ribonuclease HII [Rhodospirillales bacterium]
MPTFMLENQFAGPVAGIDEAGRGPLAGPVVAACVHVFDRSLPFFGLVRDSKKLTAHKREALFTEITRHCAFGIAVAEPGEIDRYNILQATFLAMGRAVDALTLAFDVKLETLLVDGNHKPRGLEKYDLRPVIKGDDKSVSIACASILAKVTRDRLMRELHAAHPQYGFDRHMGYPTAAHVAAIQAHGPCPHHRRSFAPVRAATV